MWHLLQLSDSLDAEFGSALAEQVPLIAWKPNRTWRPRSARRLTESAASLVDPPLPVQTFPLMHGFSRWPMSGLRITEEIILKLLLQNTLEPNKSPLICTVPYFAAVAEKWPGPVVYWLTDRIEQYASANAKRVHALDERMCSRASLVCPNSARIADYLLKKGGCSSTLIRILPNATRASNLLPSPGLEPARLPQDLRDLPRPVVGVIGNLASNMDWALLHKIIRQTRDFSWVFVGPFENKISKQSESIARRQTMLEPNVRFVGRKAYGSLAEYARSFDVAMLPYLRCEPTYSGSSTRFYEHLAAGRPMLATRAFEELLHKEPTLQLFSSAEEAIQKLAKLKSENFDDGHAVSRWEASKDGTWQNRAKQLMEYLAAT